MGGVASRRCGRAPQRGGAGAAAVARRARLPAGPATRRRGAGFSLIELVVVIVLVAGAGVLAVGVFGNGFERLQLRSAVDEVSGNLRHTRALAISTGQPQRFTIVPATGTWQAGGNRSGRLPERMSVEFTGAREVQPRADEGAIVFFPDGASTGGRVALAAGNSRWRVDVAWLTGEVRVHRAGDADGG